MKKRLIDLLFVVLFCCSQFVFAQSISKIATVEVDRLTDSQIENFWLQVKNKGYTFNQVEALVKSKGMSQIQVEKLRNRIREIELRLTPNNKNSKDVNENGIDDEILFGLTVEKQKENSRSKDSLFGYDFFNNPKISFTPNINVATPKNYQIGPGDVIQIDVWGAAEANYQEKVNKQGNIKIQGVGLINVSGLSFQDATLKIKSSLRKIYSGINAPKNSYNKVNVGISLADIRTVQVNVVGEVKTPGTYSLTALSTVLNALYAAGGPTKEGTFRKISLIRGGENMGGFDFYHYLLKGVEKGNLQLQDQDVIIVSPYQNLVTVVGEVKRPGIYETKAKETMEELLNYCGGFTAEAYKNIIVVERINGMERELKEISFEDIKGFEIKGGDKISIQKVINKFENRVKIQGAVYQPGSYEYVKGMKISSLLKKASGVRKEAFLNRALITRFTNEGDKRIIAFSVTNIYKGEDVELQPNDEIYIYSKKELREKQTVSINGAVNEPKTIDFAEGMTPEDLIALASGLKEGADTSNIEISRRLKDGSFEIIGKTYIISSNNNLSLKQKTQLYLKPYDIVFVRYMKGYTPQKNVSVKGEVEYPGRYSLTTKNERISDLLARAGGMSPYAYIEGATLIRKKIIGEQQQQILKEIQNKDTIFSEEITDKKEFRIGINLKRILENKKGKEDLILQEGDQLIIPSEKQTVEVQGEVYSPSLVRYVPGKSLKYYIESAGGFSQNAKKSKTYVVYSNGSVDATNSFLFFKSYPSVEPGATILVPRKEERKKMSAQEIIGITTGIATLGVLIDRLVK